jgi:hypothetical protein
VRVAVALAAMLALVAPWMGSAGSRKPAPPACPAARYLLAPPVVTGESGFAGDAVEAAPSAVAIAGLCEPLAPKAFKATRKGTKVRVVWPACPGLVGKVRLRGLLTDGCATLRGTLGARRFRRTLTAARSACGDGVVDPGGGEECDPPAPGVCDGGCRATVRAVIGPPGGQVLSLDGLLSLDVPPGALAAETAISVRRLALEELPDGAVAIGLDRAYRLGPAGLEFQEPVRITLRREAPPRSDGGAASAADVGLLFTVSDGVVELLRGQRLEIDAARSVVTMSAFISHFSDLFEFESASNPGLASASLEVRTTRVTVGSSFIAKVTFTSNLRLDGPSRVSNEDRTATDVVQYLGELESRPAAGGDPFDPALCSSGVVDPDERNSIGSVEEKGSKADGFVCYLCRREGRQSLVGQITVQDPDGRLGLLFGADLASLLERLGRLDTRALVDELTVDYDVPVDCMPPSTTTTLGTPGTTSTTATSTSTTSTTTTPPGAGCAGSEFPECGGACPSGQTCVPLRDPFEQDSCGCVPAFDRCGGNSCGDCPTGQVCRANGPPTNCVDAECVPISGVTTSTVSTTSTTATTTTTTSTTTTTTPLPCGLDATQSPRRCGGFCPPGLACLALTSSECRCLPESESCERRDEPTCPGFCPSPDEVCGETPPFGDCGCFVPSTTTATSTSSTSSSSTTTSTTSSSSTSATSSTSSSTSTTSTTAPSAVPGCCECAQGCASGPTVTPQGCQSGSAVCTPGPGVFVPAAFCDEAGSGNCVLLPTSTTASTSTTTSSSLATTSSTTSTSTTSTSTSTTSVPEVRCREAVATIVGTPGNDVISGTAGPDVIHGLDGNDVIDALGGDDVVCGGDGDDQIFGGEGDDRLYGDAGNDSLIGDPRFVSGSDVLEGGAGNDSLDGGDGPDVLLGEDGDDRIDGNGGPDVVSGGPGLDRLWGFVAASAASLRGSGVDGADTIDAGAGADLVCGGAGDDDIRGGDDDDVLFGQGGSDSVFGDGGDDCLVGAEGDTLDGGGGTNRCQAPGASITNCTLATCVSTGFCD